MCVLDVVVTSDSLGPYEHENEATSGEVMQHKYFESDDQPKAFPSIPKFYFVQNSKLHYRSIK